ncbi:MAG: TonB-dependent receptor [Candidatus Aureabacteria bacterium]|nr:TonB-dependent receptor [Candidatus Auribacterota bacterium]
MKQKIVSLFIVLGMAIFFLVLPSYGNENTVEEGLEFLMFCEMPKITIASKTDESLLASSGTVYIITEQDIKRYGWKDLQEILKSIPNMDLMWQYNWLNGGQRGFIGNFSGTLLLIDGREVQNLLASEAFMSWDFPAHRIKRVEILQGPNSTLYGGNATQGVINIITKFGDKGDKDLNEAEIFMGQVKTEGIAGVFKKIALDKSWELGFSASTFRTEQNWKELAEFAANDYMFSRNPSMDHLRYHGTDHFRLNEQTWTSDMYARYKEVYIGYDFFKEINCSGLEYVRYDYNRDEPRRGYRQAYIGMNHEFSENLNAFIEYQDVSEDESWLVEKLMNPLTATSYEDVELYIHGESFRETTRNRIITQVNWKMNDYNNFVAGYDYWKLNIDDLLGENNAIYPDQDLENLSDGWPVDKEETIKQSLFLQDTITFIPEKLKLTIGLRYNKQDYTNDSYLPRASLVYQPTKDSALKLTYGKAFRPPNIFEFMNVTDNVIDSQEMEMYELNYTHNLVIADVNLYNILALYSMEASNLYSKVWIGGGTTQLQGWKTIVGGSYKIQGIENLLRLIYNKFSGFAGFRYISPDKTTVAEERIVADVPTIKYKVGVSYEFLDYLNASLFIDHWSKVKTDANKYLAPGIEVYTVPAWTNVDLNINLGEFKLGSMLSTFSLYIENILDKTYYHANVRGASPVQFLQPPRTFYVKASFKS